MAEQGLRCATCGRQTLHRQEPVNNILHFLIAFFTCGLWLIVWLILGAKERPWLCTQCGTEYRHGAAWQAAHRPRLPPAEAAALRRRNWILLGWLLGVGVLGLVSVAVGLYLVGRQRAQRLPNPPLTTRPPREAGATVPRPPVRSAGNVAHDSLMALADKDRSLVLAKALPGESCVVVRTFYQGMDSKGAATWNAGCRDGRAYVVSIKADSQGSTSYMSCELLKAVTKLSCFEPLK